MSSMSIHAFPSLASVSCAVAGIALRSDAITKLDVIDLLSQENW
jgi:hypothetical protein